MTGSTDGDGAAVAETLGVSVDPWGERPQPQHRKTATHAGRIHILCAEHCISQGRLAGERMSWTLVCPLYCRRPEPLWQRRPQLSHGSGCEETRGGCSCEAGGSLSFGFRSMPVSPEGGLDRVSTAEHLQEGGPGSDRCSVMGFAISKSNVVAGQPAPTLASLPAVPGVRLKGILGTGPKGVVCWGFQKNPLRVLAVKFLSIPTDSPDDAFLSRFKRWASVTRLLNSPNLVEYYDFGIADGYCFVTMEYIQGRAAWDVLSAGSVGPARSLDMTLQILGVLEHCHSLGVTHGGLKPSNILIENSGRCRLTDTALDPILKGPTSRIADAETDMRSWAYRPPGASRDVLISDRSVDLYAAGAFLYHAISGELPVLGKARKRTEAVAVPASVNGILKGLFRRDPAHCYASARRALDDLRVVSLRLSEGRTDPQEADQGVSRIDDFWTSPSTAQVPVSLYRLGDIVHTRAKTTMRRSPVSLDTLNVLLVLGVISIAILLALQGGEPVQTQWGILPEVIIKTATRESLIRVVETQSLKDSGPFCGLQDSSLIAAIKRADGSAALLETQLDQRRKILTPLPEFPTSMCSDHQGRVFLAFPIERTLVRANLAGERMEIAVRLSFPVEDLAVLPLGRILATSKTEDAYLMSADLLSSRRLAFKAGRVLTGASSHLAWFASENRLHMVNFEKVSVRDRSPIDSSLSIPIPPQSEIALDDAAGFLSLNSPGERGLKLLEASTLRSVDLLSPPGVAPGRPAFGSVRGQLWVPTRDGVVIVDSIEQKVIDHIELGAGPKTLERIGRWIVAWVPSTGKLHVLTTRAVNS